MELVTHVLGDPAFWVGFAIGFVVGGLTAAYLVRWTIALTVREVLRRAKNYGNRIVIR